MNKLLSVCIPSYNMEKFLERNLNSFIDSGCCDGLELIVVNDGSTDHTLEIANDYHNRFPETVIVINKPNGHYGSCINAALKVACGKFFRIVDADDWIDSAALKRVMNELSTVNTDVIYTKFSSFYEKDNITKVNADPIDIEWNKVIKVNDLKIKFYIHMHQIWYRTAFLHEIGYFQTEGVCYTDTEYVVKPFVMAKDIYGINVSAYQYYVGRYDQSMSPDVLMKNFMHISKLFNSIYEYESTGRANNKFDFMKVYYLDVLLGMMVDCIYACHCKNKEWNVVMRDICLKMETKGLDLSRFFNQKIRGLRWFKWWYEDTIVSRFKLRCLFLLLDLKYS